MAKQGNWQSWNYKENGPDPTIAGRQFDNNDPVGVDVTNSGDNNIGIGNPSGRQFQDSDDMYTLKGFNVINSSDPDYPGQPSNNKLIVNVDRADRGREA